MTSELEHQIARLSIFLNTWVDEVRELDESSAKEEQPAEKAPLEEDFTEAQV